MKTKIAFCSEIGRIFYSGELRRLKQIAMLLICIIAISLTGKSAPADLDPNFGNGGKVITTVPVNGFINGKAMALQSNGKIIVAGEGRLAGGTNTNIVLVRYNADGTPDTTFGNGGMVFTDIAGRNDKISRVAVQNDGKIIVAGTTQIATFDDDILVVKYNSDGSLDTTFDGDGIAVITFGLNSESFGTMTLYPDGKIFIAGATIDSASFDGKLLLVRLNPDGSFDTTFSGDGKIIQDLACISERANAMTVQPDGNFLLAGQCVGGGRFYNFVIRYTPNGSLDNTFADSAGIKYMYVNSNSQPSLNEIAVQRDGKIVIVGKTFAKFYAVRLNANGAYDNFFSSIPTNEGDLYSVAIQPNGKIVTAGSGAFFTTLRFNADASLDTNFGNAGIVTTQFLQGSFDTSLKVVIQPDGKILVAGNSNGSTFSLVRYMGDAVLPAKKLFDYDGDGKADVSVFRPASGDWYLNRSTAGFAGVSFGVSTDKLTPEDYDGDNKTDISVFRDGFWYLLKSSDGTFSSVYFGQTGDVPVPGDYDGDGRADQAVYRNGIWYLNRSTSGFQFVSFGLSTDKAVPADYDGDGKTDIAIYREGAWHYIRSTNGATVTNSFGVAADKPIPADYDGDGKADLAVFREGNWYLNRSTSGFAAISFGLPTDIPVAADYDGDGKADVAVFRNGSWYQLQSSNNGFAAVNWGQNGDAAIQAAYIR